MEVRRLGQQIGAEITGVDVRTMDDATFAKIYQAWLDYNVIAVRDQHLTLDDFRKYSERFGVLHPHYKTTAHHQEHPEITIMGINKFDADGKLNIKIYARGAKGFHTDAAYDKNPPKATQLYGLAIPSRGGDTHFASLYAAREAIPQHLVDRLQGLSGAYVLGGPKRTVAMSDEERKAKIVLHKILTEHPETGRKVLYFDPTKILYIDGLGAAENEALVKELTGYMLQTEGLYSHKWVKGDIVIWDNRCSLHKAGGDYPPEEDRIHWRCTINDYAKAH